MVIAVDFDGTVVHLAPHDDVSGRFVPRPGAVETLQALRNAGHTLLLYSARSNRALREDPTLDPLVRAGVRKVNLSEWQKYQPLYQKRYDAMVAWVSRNLPGVFAAVDDGQQGKPLVDLFIDDKALSALSGRGGGWALIRNRYA